MKKNDPLEDGNLTEKIRGHIISIGSEPHSSFTRLAEIAGLDKRRDFRFSNLRGVDLSNCDLRGFDFTGADLHGSIGIGVTWDFSTIFFDAELDDSIFSSKIQLESFFERDQAAASVLERTARLDWIGQALWVGENFKSSGRYNNISLQVAEALFYRTNSKFLISELMRYISRKISNTAKIREIILYALSRDDVSISTMRTMSSLIRKRKMQQDETLRSMMNSLCHSKNISVKSEAVKFIVSTSINRNEILSLLDASISGDNFLGTLIIAEISQIMGQEYEVIVRDPTTNAVFQLGEYIDKQKMRLIARRLLRVKRSTHKADKDVPLIKRRGSQVDVDEMDIADMEAKTKKMYERMEGAGVSFKFEDTSRRPSIKPDAQSSNPMD